MRIQPASVVALTDRCLAILGLENYVAAVEDCSRAREARPDYARAHNNRGALEDLELAIQLDPVWARGYRYCGLVRASVGDRVRARTDLEHATELYLADGDAQGYDEVQADLIALR